MHRLKNYFMLETCSMLVMVGYCCSGIKLHMFYHKKISREKQLSLSMRLQVDAEPKVLQNMYELNIYYKICFMEISMLILCYNIIVLCCCPAMLAIWFCRIY